LVGEIAADDLEGFIHIVRDNGAVQGQQLGDNGFEGGIRLHRLKL